MGESGQVKGVASRSYQSADWMGLEIAELVGLSVAKSEATCLF